MSSVLAAPAGNKARFMDVEFKLFVYNLKSLSNNFAYCKKITVSQLYIGCNGTNASPE